MILRSCATAVLVCLAAAPPAAAQFELTEVSGLGAPPFLLAKTGGRFEDLSGTVPGVAYNIYRRLPGDGFRCLVQGLAMPSWTGDPASPTRAVWWYTVNAYDGTVENVHGNQVAILQPCHQGTCCTGGVCAVSAPAACAAGGGTYGGDGTTCQPTTCLATGACCVGTTCSVETPGDCLAAGGTYQGDGSTCTAPVCAPRGACCSGTNCTVETAATCSRAGGTYRGDGTTCQATTCDAQGACCVGLTCSVLAAADCTLAGGTYQGDGTTCGITSCAASGACCDPLTRACGEGTAAACTASCGVYAGDGTTCGTGMCTTGACCTGNTCAATTAASCVAGGGRFMGLWTTCGTGTCACAPVTGTPPLRLVRVDPPGSFTRPVHLAAPPGDVSRLFVVEKVGRIRILRGGSVLATPFLDISSRVVSGGNEQGLFSMAFHPDYGRNGKLYVQYTAAGGGPSGHSAIEEFTVSAGDPDVADPASARVLLTVDQPFSNHNGGQLAFGPRDGYLYIGLGDGGSANDPGNRSQNMNELLGKLLRIDVNCAEPPLAYRIPPDNPFVGQANTREEIWALGLRNPWRFSFDRLTGDLYIGDVGQNCWEEVNAVPAASRGGENYGWRPLEGFHCRSSPCGTQLCGAGCAAAPSCAPFTPPVIELDQNDGPCSVTGGHVYQGCRLPGYRGTYFYSDYCSDETWSFVFAGGAATMQRNWSAAFTQVNAPTSYGEDGNGELYILNDSNGSIYRILD